jgi:hypothetical protein
MSKIKTIPTLDKYFQSSLNANDENPILVPSHVSHSLLHFSSKTSSFDNKDDLLSTSMHNNHVATLICPSGLPYYVASFLDVCEIIDIHDVAKPPKKKLKKSYEVSKKCEDT